MLRLFREETKHSLFGVEKAAAFCSEKAPYFIKSGPDPIMASPIMQERISFVRSGRIGWDQSANFFLSVPREKHISTSVVSES